MSHDRKAGELCALTGLSCCDGRCVQFNRCMHGDSSAVSESAARKASPVWAGVLNYFPDALMAVARVSKAGNDKHNPGQPLHWSRDKSSDHLDCAARHMLTPFAIDPDSKEIHLANAAWRILAELQLYQEKQRASH